MTLRPGAWDGRALVDGFEKGDLRWITPASLVLPPACWVYDTHAWCESDPHAEPVGVAVPTVTDGGCLHVRCVMATHPGARACWNKLTHGVADRLSIVPFGHKDEWTIREGHGGIRFTGWPLISVDVVHRGADPGAMIEAVWGDLSDAEAEVQADLDNYLTDIGAPRGIDAINSLDPLAVLASPADLAAPLAGAGVPA